MTRLVTLVLFLFVAIQSTAQDYGFELPTVLFEAWVEEDGTLTLEHEFEIRNAPDARALDGVDVGMPSTNWSISRVRAWIDDQPVRDIVKSPYVKNAAAANLPDGGLPPGQSARVRVRVEGVSGLLFADTTDPVRVSLRITPTWFDGRYVRGETVVRLIVHLPPGIPAEALTWHDVPWHEQVLVQATPERPEHPAVAWQESRRFTGPWQVGVSFPRQVADASGVMRPTTSGVREITTWDLFEAWASEPGVRGKALLAFMAAFTLLFFWASRRTGCVPWGILSAILLVVFAIKPVMPILLAPALPLAAWLVRWSRIRKKRAYVPAVASVEGGGIKRGLTAPEAACLLEAPPEKILLLVLYGLSRKKLAVLEAKEPKGMVARALDGFGLGMPSDLERAAKQGSVLHPYESAFLSLLKSDEPIDVATIDWRKALKGVAEHAASRLQGHDIDETRAYYEKIVQRAWKEAASVGNVELRKEAVDRTFDWLVLEPNAWKRMDGWHRAGWRYSNPWLPGARTPMPPGVPTVGGGKGPPALPGAPKASDVAGSLGGRLEGLTGSFATALGLGTAGPGVLRKVDSVSADAFKSILSEMAKSSGGSSGGGGSSCACACAGCACACACAGGGR